MGSKLHYYTRRKILSDFLSQPVETIPSEDWNTQRYQKKKKEEGNILAVLGKYVPPIYTTSVTIAYVTEVHEKSLPKLSGRLVLHRGSFVISGLIFFPADSKYPPQKYK